MVTPGRPTHRATDVELASWSSCDDIHRRKLHADFLVRYVSARPVGIASRIFL
jgi:hypothetical protein